MNNGVALLLERMETHPEEFVEGTKWGHIMQDMHKYASKEDSEALNNGLRTLMMQSLTERVLEELVDPKKSEKWESHTYTSATPLGGQIQAQSSAQQKAMQLQAMQAQHQAHINAHQQALGALGVNSATQSIGYGAGATNLLRNIFGSNK
jgi:hypothetical protein